MAHKILFYLCYSICIYIQDLNFGEFFLKLTLELKTSVTMASLPSFPRRWGQVTWIHSTYWLNIQNYEDAEMVAILSCLHFGYNIPNLIHFWVKFTGQINTTYHNNEINISH